MGFLTPPARCHSNSAVTPDAGPEADSQQKTSLYETAAREEILNVTKVEDGKCSYLKNTSIAYIKVGGQRIQNRIVNMAWKCISLTLFSEAIHRAWILLWKN